MLRTLIPGLAATALAGLALAEGAPVMTIDPPAEGTVTREQGLEAFDRIHEVVSHPRCANCHVGAENVPMWSGPIYGQARRHGMNVNAGESRMGAETLVCSTCHRTSDSFATDPHAPPRAALDWMLPPVDFEWFGKTPSEICAQLSDPDRTGGRDWMGLAEHLVQDSGHRGFVLWGWNPGGGREAAPYSLQDHVDDVLAWGVAGMPCPQDN